MLLGLPGLAKEKITKQFLFPICLCQRETIYNFLQIINSKLIPELVSSD